MKLRPPSSFLPISLPIAIVLAACADRAQPAKPSETLTSGSEPLVVFLVRHAEKVDSSRDAPLSAAGRERAEGLAQNLRSAELDAIHSTDFARTRDTAIPLAELLGLRVQLYDPDHLEAFARGLREAGGRHLVVGHSNTTPRLVEQLGGERGRPIEYDEYDRLYVLTAPTEGRPATTIVLRYGKKS